MIQWRQMKTLLTSCFLISLICAVAGAQPQRTNSNPSKQQIKEAEVSLSKLGYWTGRVDGIFDQGAQSALIAFQKWEGRPVTGQITPDELEAIRRSSAPTARETGYE